MKDTIIKLFNLEPRDIEQIDICSENYTVFVFITLRKQLQRCPKCGCSTKRIHDYRRRTLEHGVINDAPPLFTSREDITARNAAIRFLKQTLLPNLRKDFPSI